jgi:hypothetical protein
MSDEERDEREDEEVEAHRRELGVEAEVDEDDEPDVEAHGQSFHRPS